MKYSVVLLAVLAGVVFASELELQHNATRTIPGTFCRWCKSCGNGYDAGGGRKLNQGDFSAWTAFSDSCAEPYVTTMDEVSLCCLGASWGQGQCSLCESCGGAFPYPEGNRIDVGDWGPYSQRGQQCSGGLRDSWSPPTLCCKYMQRCRICDSYCGTQYPTEVGAITHEGDYGMWDMYPGGCGGATAPSWGHPKFCCGP